MNRILMSMEYDSRWISARFASACALAICFVLTGRGAALGAALQVSSTPGTQGAVAQAGSGPAASVSADLKPALDGVGVTLGRLQIDHWKLSRAWKSQLRGDADSIQQDLTGQIPQLLSAAQQSPGTLAPQLNLLHNVDALYDVLVRISMAADLTGNKSDAAYLSDAVSRLESARKSAAGRLLAAASMRDAEMVRVERAAPGAQPAAAPKTIVVDDTGRHTRRHKRLARKKPPAAAAASPAHLQ